MIYISNQLKTITLTRRGSFVPSVDTYSLLMTNNYSQFNCTIELEDTSENPKKFVFELTDEQFESLDFGEYNFVLMNGSDKVYAGMLRVIQEFESDVVYQWSHGDQPEPQPVYYDVYIAAGENGHLLIGDETYTVYADTVLKGTRLTVEAVADNGYQINSWSDGNTSATRSFVVNSNITLLVAFEAVPATMYPVSISAGNNGSVSVNGVTGNYNEQVEEGTVLTVVATPDQDYQFQGWSDGDLNQTRTITVTSNVTISAAFEAIPSTMYWVNINSGANGQVSVNGVVGNYSQQVPENTILSVEAIPATGYEFVSWNDGNTHAQRNITVTGDVQLQSSYQIMSFTVSIASDDTNEGTVTVNGTTGDYSSTMTYGSLLSFSATPATGYVFVSWSDGDTNAFRITSVTSNISVTALFAVQTFIVSISGDAHTNVTVNGTPAPYTGTVNYGTQLSLVATPDTGYDFQGWSDGDVNTTRSITVTADTTLSCTSAIQTFSVSISAGNNGSVSVNGVSGNYSDTVNYGTQLALVATPDTGYNFTAWSDGNTSATRTVTVTGNLTLTSSYAIQTLSVSITGDAHTAVTVDGTPAPYSQTVNYGTQLALVATPDTGYDFQGWSDGNNNTSRTITVTQNTTLSCSSAIQTFNVSITAGNNGSVEVNGVSGNYNQTVNYGTVLTVEAVPNNNYSFVSWSDGNSTNPRTITVTSNVTLTCSFEENIQVLPNQLKYRTQSGDPVVPNGNFYDDNSNGLQILSNTYTDGIGVIELDGNAYYMDNEMFNRNTDLTEVYFPPYLSVSDLGFGNCTNLVKFETEDTANSPFRYVDGGGFENCTSLTRLVFPPSFTSFKWNVINGSGVNYLELQAYNFAEIYFYSGSVSGLQQNGTFVTKASVFDTEFGGEWQGLFDNGWHWESLEPMLKLWDTNWSSATILANDYDIRDANGDPITATDTFDGGNQHWITFSAEPVTINKLFDSNTGGRVYYAVICCNELQSIGSDVFQYCGNLGNITSFTVTAPTVQNDTFKGVPLNGTLQYQSVSNYSTWLSTSGYYLGWYGWNGIGNIILVKSSSSVGLRNGYLTDSNNSPITASLVENDGNGVYRIALSGIPAHIADSTVSGDDYGWLDGDRTVVSQVIWYNASNLRTIGDNAFNGLTVYFDNNMPNLTVIGDYAFKGANIQGYEFITENITSIGTGAFLDAYNNTGSGGIRFKGTFTEIPEDALNFNNGVWLSIHSRNISDIGANAFGNATELMFTSLQTATVNDFDQSMFSSKYNGYNLIVPANQYVGIESAFPNNNNIYYLPTMYYTTYDGQPAYDKWGGQWLDSIYANGSGVAIVREGNVSDNINTVTDFYGDIPGGLFGDTSRLTTFNFAHVTSIDNESFDNSAITNIAIPAGCTSIGYGLARTNTVTSVTVDASNPNYYAVDNCVMRKSDDVCIYCPAIGNPPEGVTGFDGWCMSGTHRVTDLVIPSTFDGLTHSCCFYETCSIPNVWFNGDPSQMTGEFDDGTFRDNNTPCWVDSAYYNDCVSRWPGNNWRTDNEILYKSHNNDVVTPYMTNDFGANIVSNTNTNGQGVIKFDGNVTSIGDWAFAYRDGLITMTIPKTVTRIGSSAFHLCENLTSINIPSGVTSIGSQAFRGCENLTSLILPDSVISIGSSAFENCYKITSITIPSTLTSMGSNSVFKGCERLTSVTLPNCVTTIGMDFFYNCIKLTSITIPNGVTTIGDNAFYRCRITSLTIPSNVTSFGHNVFNGCSALTAITSKNIIAPSVEDDTFKGVGYDGVLTFPSVSDYSSWLSVNTYYLGYYGWNQSTFNLPDNQLVRYKTRTASQVTPTTTSGWGATYKLNHYDSATQEGELVFDAPVTSFPENAFLNDTNLTYVEIPANTTSIGNHAFEGCSYLEEIFVNPENEPTVGAETFKDIKTGGKLLTYTTSFPRQKTYVDINYTNNWLNYDTYKLGSYGWNGLNGNINYYNNSYYHFRYHTDNNAADYLVDQSKFYSKGTTAASYIGNFHISGDQSQMRFTNNFLNVGIGAFTSASHLTMVNLDRNVYIVNAAFRNNTTVEEVWLHNPIIGQQTFYGCTALRRVQLYYCKYIGAMAFSGNTNLNYIFFSSSTPPIITNLSFVDMPATGTVSIPTGSDNDYAEILSYLPGWTVSHH